MRRYVHRVAGEEVTIHRVESLDDLADFREFIRRNLKIIACDSETTGLDWYSPDFRVRVVQFGTLTESYVIPVEHGGQFVEDVRRALRGVEQIVFQNGGFDLQVFDKHLDVKLEEMWPKTIDTLLLAKLIDPRPSHKGGFGASLEELTANFISADLAENVKGLMTKLAKEHKTTKSKIWSLIDLDHPEYNLYAGMDTILAARLSRILLPKVPGSARPLIKFEHKVAEICSYMERNGFLLDVEYARSLAASLRDEEAKQQEIAATYGVEKVGSTQQVADALEDMGFRDFNRTEKGNRKVDDETLSKLADRGNQLADAVMKAKAAGKKASTWVEKFLDTRDENNRCHPIINTLQARTGRMSVTGIPAQQLPSDSWEIRRCFLADPGQYIGSIDYKTQELRVLAALSGDKVMARVFAEGADLHQTTADTAGVSRKVGKTTNFQYVYGSGAKNIAGKAGVDVSVARKVIEGFEQAYPDVKRYSSRLQDFARYNGFVQTPSGRKLPVDKERPYSALNYMIQSTSRDVTCRGLIKLHEAGFTPYLRMPIHDEVVASLPIPKAEWGAGRIGDLMSETMNGVLIGTDPEVTGKSWGHGYMKDKEDNPLRDVINQADQEIMAAGLW